MAMCNNEMLYAVFTNLAFLLNKYLWIYFIKAIKALIIT